MRPSILPLLAALLAAGPAQAGYVLQDISGNGVFQNATAINNAGQVVGGGEPFSGAGYYYSATTGLSNLAASLPPGTASTASLWSADINASGLVVGNWSPEGGNAYRGFTYTPATGLRDLGVAPLYLSGITDGGRVVGFDSNESPESRRVFVGDPVAGDRFYTPAVPLLSVTGMRDDGALVGTRYDTTVTFGQRAGVLQGDVWTNLPMSSRASASWTSGFNEHGTVVGGYEWPYLPAKAWLTNAFAYFDGGFVDIGARLDLSEWSSTANAVNEHDIVVGTGLYSWIGGEFSFIYDLAAQSFVDLATALDPVSTAGWSELHFADINDRGQIVGSGLLNGERRAFLLSPTVATPVPEPATGLLLLLGSGLVAAGVRRRPPRG